MLAVGGAESNASSHSRADGSDAPPTPEEVQPLFPHLQIIRLIGQGGMGAVYEAKQRGLGRTVALKLLWAPKQLDAAFEQRFAREGQALAQLSHDHIVTVHDAGKSGPYYWLVMEYVDGANLRDLLEQGRLTPEQALPMVGQICTALEYAHQQGIVHRDIKPENILIGRDGHVKVADFGLAKMLSGDRKEPMLTQSFLRLGTPHYMAPEQLNTPKEVDHRADIYSLGVVLYELLTGELPIGRFDMPSKVASVDPRLDGVVTKALQKSPSRRYQAISDVQRAVQNIADSRGQLPTSKRRSDASRAQQWPIMAGLIATVALTCFFAWQYFDRNWRAEAATRTLEQRYASALEMMQSPAQREVAVATFEHILKQDPDRPGLREQLRDACQLRAADLIRERDAWDAVRLARRADELVPSASTKSLLVSAEREARKELESKVILTSPKPGAVLDEPRCTIKGSVPRTIKGQISINRMPADKSANGDFYVHMEGLSEGDNALTLSVTEEDGLVVSMPVVLRVDTQNPDLKCATPADHAVVGNPIILTGTVSDDSPVIVSCEGFTASVPEDGRWTLSVEVSTQGEHLLAIAAIDAAGRRSVSRRTVEVDLVAPEIQIKGDQVELATMDAGLEVQVRASDEHLSTFNAGGAPLQVGRDGYAKWFVFAGENEGGVRITTFEAKDAAGNVRKLDVSVRKDTTKPIVKLDSSSDDIFPGSQIQVTGVVEDESECDVLLGSGVARSAGKRFTSTVIVVPPTWKPGTPFSVKGKARDLAGNVSEVEAQFSISKPCENCQSIDGRRGECRKCSGLGRRVDPCGRVDCRNNPNGEGIDLCSACQEQLPEAPECRVCEGDGLCTQCSGSGLADRTVVESRRGSSAQASKGVTQDSARQELTGKPSSMFDTELVLNGDCEQPAVGGGVPQWEIVNGDWIPLETPGGMRDARSGSFFFRPTGRMAIEEIRQDIDISEVWKKPRIGTIVVRAGARVCGHYQRGAGDESHVVVEYLDKLGRPTGAPLEYGPAWTVPWFNVELSGELPKDARTIRVRLIAHRQRGSFNDGYFDNISIKLSEIPR